MWSEMCYRDWQRMLRDVKDFGDLHELDVDIDSITCT